MKTIVAAAVALLLVGCATSGTQMQAECEARFTAFPDIYRCTSDQISARNPGIRSDARAKLYLLRGEQLAQLVTDGKMTGLDAKVEWQSLFVSLKSAHDKEIMDALASIPRPVIVQPAASADTSSSGRVSCTSTRIGDSVFTNCNR